MAVVTEPPSPPATEGRRLLVAVLGATFFVRFAFGLTVAVFASYIAGASSGIDTGIVGTVGLVSAMAPIGEFSTVLFSGTAADRYGRVPVLVAGMAGAAGLFALVSLTRDPVTLALLNLLFGVTSGAILAASLAVVAGEAFAPETGFEMGRFDAMNLLGWIGGFAVGFGFLGTLPNDGLAWVFRGGALLLLAGVLIALRAGRRRLEPRLNPRANLGQIRRAITDRAVLLVTVPWFVIYLLLGTVFVFLGSAATGAGLPTVEIAALIGGGGAILLATQPYFGRLADRFGRMRLMTVGTIGFVGVLACAVLLQSYGPRPELLGALGVSALAALAYGPAALAALAELAQSYSRATTMAVYTLTISLGMIVGLALSTTLYARFGAVGLDAFFGSIAVALVGLTVARAATLGARPPPVTTPAR
ncbi:MAG TPA: MFS transporter [Thermoplasmata archaeon]|nr:MFS transporter [Thermoplasmata archaeon]